MKKIMSWALLALLFAAFSTCKDKDPEKEEEPELITTLTYTLTPTSGDVVTLSFSDPDGDEGGIAPTVIGGTLQANMTYTGSLDLLNESVTPSESITAEIAEEDLEHQFFFYTGGGLDLTVAYGDQDSNGNPLGLASTLTTGSASDGTLTIVLKHEPVKDASGVSDGDITNAGGETDIQVNFDVTIQ